MPQLPLSSPSPCCLRCLAGPGASPAVELGSLEGPPWAKPGHVLELGKRAGGPWLGKEDSRGSGGNFDCGRGALAGIPRALVGQALQLLPSRRAIRSSQLERRSSPQPQAFRRQNVESLWCVAPWPCPESAIPTAEVHSSGRGAGSHASCRHCSRAQQSSILVPAIDHGVNLDVALTPSGPRALLQP